MGDKISPKQLKAATTELLKFVHKKNEETTQLIDANDETITLQYTLLNMPTNNLVSGTKYMRAPMIPLPHPLFGKSTDKTCCLFVRDPPKNDPEFWKRWHRENPLPGLTKIMPIRKLKGKYRHFEGKRSLSQRFDLFLCDSVVVNMTQDLLGSTFLKKAHKYPHTVVLGEKPNVNKYKQNVPKAMESVQCRLPSSSSGAVKVGRCNMTVDQVLENMKVVLEHLWTAFDAQYGLRSVHVRATGTPALSLWEIPAEETQAVKFRKKKKETADSSDSEDSEEKPAAVKRKRQLDTTASDATKPSKKSKKNAPTEGKHGKKNASAAAVESVETNAPKKAKHAKKNASAAAVESVENNAPKKAKHGKKNAPAAEVENVENNAPKKAKHGKTNAPAAEVENVENNASKKAKHGMKNAPVAEVENIETNAPKKAKRAKNTLAAEVKSVEKNASAAEVESMENNASKKAKRAKKNVPMTEVESAEKNTPVTPDAVSTTLKPLAPLKAKKSKQMLNEGQDGMMTPVNSKSHLVRMDSVQILPTPMAPKKNYGGSLQEIEMAAGFPRKLELLTENNDDEATVTKAKKGKKSSTKDKENCPL
eukprot:GEMP01022819.1.p1 GENE.GEMP01022819.1~~GEMP01022819.1.p1  ORF type:complete len:598 (+),score=147.12 GEMP01022819.1:22-1794(+)